MLTRATRKAIVLGRKLYSMSSVDPADTKTELFCGATRMALSYVEDRYGRELMEDLAYSTRMNLDYLQDSRNWVSLAYFYRLLDRLVECTGNPNAPYEVGLYGAKSRSSGLLEILARRLGTPRTAYRIWIQLTPRWSKANEWKLLRIDDTSCRISVRNYGHFQNRNNCLCIQGTIASAPTLFGLPPAKVNETECACQGAGACVYEVSWVDFPRRLGGGLGFAVRLAAGVAGAWILGGGTSGNVLALLFSLVGYFWGREIDYERKLRSVYRRHDETAASLEESMRATEELNEELQERVEQRTDELFKSTQELEQALTELKESRERELVAEKQAAIGVLAGGTAHEINNPLNAVSLCIQSLKEDVADEKLVSQLELAARATRRCKRIVNDLLSLSREPQQQGASSIEKILREALTLFGREDAGEVEIKMTVSPDLPSLMVDRMQIQQAILNLLKNASDAMEGKGVAEVILDADDENVTLSVSDQGPGIKEEDRKKIFDPFFTTKRTGKGMGLGLSITYQLVRRNGGTIEVESDGKKGATFAMVFPLVPTQEQDRADHHAVTSDDDA